MPELPETETIARDLDGALRGAVLRSVEVLRADVLRPRTATTALGALRGAAIAKVWRRAKSIVIELRSAVPHGTAESAGARSAAYAVVVTPRFTGALLLDGDADEAYTCLRFSLADGRLLRYHDVRRLGTVAVLDPAGFAAWESTLGPEPLDPDLSAERFSGIIRGSRRAVKTILMDQRRLAGVGNIYANEALWRAGIRPSARGASVTRARTSALLDSLRSVLRESIALRGTTFRDFRDAYGERGGFAAKLQAYGRAGQPCLRCGNALRSTHKLEGRQTVWCAQCQK
ncbi:MAG: bifunctional DNA-formamidopyrimidine glycosylase/DNA-(apurinic or apyrimidinic site) lyase [Gemmatimonadaceae bacterium]